MATQPLKLPPGATLVSDGSQDQMPLPPGATLVSHGTSPNFSYQPAGVSGAKPTEIPGQVAATKQFLKDIPIGFLKSGAQSVQRMAEVNPPLGVPMPPHDMLAPAIKPNTAGEKTGAAVEQGAEMMAAGGPMRAGVQGLASKLPFLGKFMGPGARVAAESMNAASNAAMHDQDPNSAALVGGGGAALGEVASPIATAVANKLNKSAVSQYSKFLNPTKETTKFETKQIVPGLINRKVIATSPENLANKASANMDTVGSQIDQAVQNVPPSVKPDIQNIMQSIDQYASSHMVNGVPVGASAESAVENANRVKQNILDIVNAPGGSVSYASINRARQILDNAVSQSGAYAGKTLKEGVAMQADQAAANAIRAELARQSPDIAALNKEFHFWAQVKDVASQTELRRTGQQGGLARIFSPIIGTAAGLGHGGFTTAGGTDAALYSITLLGLTEAVRSPLWRTTSPIFKNQLADLIASGNFKKAGEMLTYFGAAGSSMATSPQSAPQGNSPQTTQLPFLRQ